MIEERKNRLFAFIEFLLLFLFYEGVFIFGLFILVKAALMQVTVQPLARFLFAGLKENARSFTIVDFFYSAGDSLYLLTFFALIAAYTARE